MILHNSHPTFREKRTVYRGMPPENHTVEVSAIDRDLNCSVPADARLSVQTSKAFVHDGTDGKGRVLIGKSNALKAFQYRLAEVATTDLTVLIFGETGVGKGLAARVLHETSRHGDGPFVHVNCGAVSESLINSELFGHERGAFTSAVSRRLGKVELAGGGTLFLDEIGDMSFRTQTSLLQFLDDGTYERVGGSETLRARTRIVAATNCNLKEMVEAGDFREDLYYRFQVFPLYLRPLRERKEDIPELAEYFRHRVAIRQGKQIAPLSTVIVETLQTYDWPGNVRELEHLIQRTVTICRGSRISLTDLELGSYRSRMDGKAQDLVRAPPAASRNRDIAPLAEAQRRHIIKVLETTNWRISGARGAAALLGLPPSSLYGKMRKLDIRRP